MSLIDRIDALLPQTQCTRCGFPSCRAYAGAVAAREASIDRCPPGGSYTLERLAALTGEPARELDPRCGAEAPRRVAAVIERWCIGCTLCIQACPVDAIIGGAKRMHVVIERLCTGCELCVAPCPVDCIEMVPPSSGPRTPEGWLRERAADARRRFELRAERLERRARMRAEGQREGERRAVIAAAVARVRARRAHGARA